VLLSCHFAHAGIIAADINTAFCCRKEASNKGMFTKVLIINDYINFIDATVRIESPIETDMEDREGLSF
jgi:hypothetical protein